MVEASKTGYSMLKPKQSTAQRIVQIMQEQGLLHHFAALSTAGAPHAIVSDGGGIVQPLLFDVALMEKAAGADAPSLATPARSRLRVISRPTADQEPEE